MRKREAEYGGDLDAATRSCLAQLSMGDVVITLGAGSITRSARVLLKALKDDQIVSG
jgi:hypothetical protein